MARCVESVLAQTYSDIEIILVDDGSPAPCPALCDAYAREDARVRVLHKPNGGLSDARNKGLEIARGEYVLFLDSDDYFELDACEGFAAYAKTGADILIGDGETIGAVKDLTHLPSLVGEVLSGAEFLKRSYAQSIPSMAAWLNAYKRSFLLEKELRFPFGLLHEDEHFTPRALLSAESVVCTGKNFYRYIVREDSIMTRKDKRKNADHLFGTLEFLAKYYERVDDETLRDALYNSLVTKYLYLFYEGRLERYGDTYVKKAFVKKCSKGKKNKWKARLFCLSPKLYVKINDWTKK